MYQGVVRDDERRREKQRQRQVDYERSQKNREILERAQGVGSIMEEGANNNLAGRNVPG
jgi:protein PET117